MINKIIPIPEKNLGNTNQIKAYKNNSPVNFTNSQIIKYPLPDYDSLVEITKLSNQINFELKNLEQKQLLLQSTKEQYRKKLLCEEKDIRSRIITIKKRQNISQLIDKIRQSEIQLQNKILERIEKYKPANRLDKKQKNNLLMALIHKVTDVN
jgi:hypothetical protein